MRGNRARTAAQNRGRSVERVSRQLQRRNNFEEKYLSDGTIYDKLAELRVMRKLMDMSAKMISLGEIAAERMKEIGG